MTIALPDPGGSLVSLHDGLRTFTAFDWLIAAIVLWSVVRGLIRGVIREFFALLGVLGGLLAAAWYYAQVAIWLSRWLRPPEYAGIAAFLLIAVLVLLAVLLLGRLVRSAAHLVGLGLLDRLAGALFGFLRASLLGAAILMACTTFLPALVAVQHSRLAPGLLQLAHLVSRLAPGDLQARIALGLAHLHPPAAAFP